MPVVQLPHFICALHPGQEVVARNPDEEPVNATLPREQRWVTLFGEYYCPRAALLIAQRLSTMPPLTTEQIFAPDPDWRAPAQSRRNLGHLPMTGEPTL